MVDDSAFHIGDLLSISTGLLVSPEHIGGVYKILNHMTGDDLMTHQLPLACDAMTPDLLQQHPWLKGLTPPKGADKADLLSWLSWAASEHGERHEVAPAPHAWGRHDPIQDFRNEHPDTPIVAVDLGD